MENYKVIKTTFIDEDGETTELRYAVGLDLNLDDIVCKKQSKDKEGYSLFYKSVLVCDVGTKVFKECFQLETA